MYLASSTVRLLKYLRFFTEGDFMKTLLIVLIFFSAIVHAHSERRIECIAYLGGPLEYGVYPALQSSINVHNVNGVAARLVNFEKMGELLEFRIDYAKLKENDPIRFDLSVREGNIQFYAHLAVGLQYAGIAKSYQLFVQETTEKFQSKVTIGNYANRNKDQTVRITKAQNQPPNSDKGLVINCYKEE